MALFCIMSNNYFNDKLRNMELKYFKLKEFESPDLPGSGDKMDLAFLQKLDKCRELAGVPFKITSGFRTAAYNINLGKRGYKIAKNSPHLKGVAADIVASTSDIRYRIITSALAVGITRIGIGKTFIHLDTDATKSQNVIWHYY